jgi:DeoR/GlpR family transcriptional regulator of sugar metabolism
VIVACAGSKWNASAVALVTSLDAVDAIVTDRQLSPEERDQLTQRSVEAVIV